MKVLVAITHYGTKNAAHCKTAIAEYRSMSLDIDIVVLCEARKELDPGVTELVGLPIRDSRSLPFAHRRLFVEQTANYDLFIYTEDDIMISEENIRAFLRASEVFPENMLPGFIRYENFPDGRKNYPDIHRHFHWVPGSVAQIGEYIYAYLSNDHAACYILTRQQLKRAIHSGGFALSPHSGRYDLLCTAATDPYTQCGFTRIICLSHLENFEVHHLPNTYINKYGLSEEDHRLQFSALLDVLQRKLSAQELFSTVKRTATLKWNRNYYEACRLDLLEYIPRRAVDILSVGCGSGDTEAHLIELGKRVRAIPLDWVIGHLAQNRGVSLVPPNFAEAFELLSKEWFDAILMGDVLQHLRNPIEILSQLAERLKPNGVIIGSVANLGLMRRLFGRLVLQTNDWSSIRGSFDETGLQLTSRRRMRQWLKASGLHVIDMRLEKRAPFSRLGGLRRLVPDSVAAFDIVFVARKMTID